MPTGKGIEDRRGAPRESASETIWWKAGENEWLKRGRLVERCSGGAAFVIECQTPPPVGCQIRLLTRDIKNGGYMNTEVVAKRVEAIGRSAFHVAAQVPAREVTLNRSGITVALGSRPG